MAEDKVKKKYWNQLLPRRAERMSPSDELRQRNKMSALFSRYMGIKPTTLAPNGEIFSGALPEYCFLPIRIKPEPNLLREPLPKLHKFEDVLYDDDDDEEDIRHLGYGLWLTKLVSSGGQGKVFLCKYYDPDDVQKERGRNYLLKISRREDDVTILDEVDFMKHFAGHKHLLQPADAHFTIEAEQRRQMGGVTEDETVEADQFKERWDLEPSGLGGRARPFILMEHQQRGSLIPWLAKFSQNKQQFPNRALWMLFECLVKALIGMAYPDKDQERPVDETIPRNEKGRPRVPARLVHMDIDAFNVFVGVDEDHKLTPIFKIGDYGTMINMSPQLFDEHRKLYPERRFRNLRSKGKFLNYPPECFTSDWDQFKRHPGVRSPPSFEDPRRRNRFIGLGLYKPEVAGNYGIHTNVFQVGIVMWMAITLRWWTMPKVLKRVNRSFQSYGWEIAREENNADDQLRLLICKCLAHNPKDRPSLSSLEKAVSSRMERGFDGDDESDQNIAKWMLDAFSMPGFPFVEVAPHIGRAAESPTRDDNDGDGGDGEGRESDDCSAGKGGAEDGRESGREGQKGDGGVDGGNKRAGKRSQPDDEDEDGEDGDNAGGGRPLKKTRFVSMFEHLPEDTPQEVPMAKMAKTAVLAPPSRDDATMARGAEGLRRALEMDAEARVNDATIREREAEAWKEYLESRDTGPVDDAEVHERKAKIISRLRSIKWVRSALKEKLQELNQPEAIKVG